MTYWLLMPVIAGSVFSVLTIWAARRQQKPTINEDFLPPVTILKPIYGLEKSLANNLHSFCQQDYPHYQLVLSLQDPNDPARPLLEQMAKQYPQQVTLAIDHQPPVVNGKVQNLAIGLKAARHDYLLISDSDVQVDQHYLRQMMAPLRSEQVGYVCSFYRAVKAQSLPEVMELLTMNTDFLPALVFAHHFKTSPFCLGASTALHRQTLQEIGGFESLQDYLVEDYEMGRRIRQQGLAGVILPMTVDLVVDLPSWQAWWQHQLYWDQNTRAAQFWGFLATGLIRAVPFGVLYWLISGASPLGWSVLLITCLVRWATGLWWLKKLQDPQAYWHSLWIIPRDLAGLLSWLMALGRRHFIWRGHRFRLTRQGRIKPIKTP